MKVTCKEIPSTSPGTNQGLGIWHTSWQSLTSSPTIAKGAISPIPFVLQVSTDKVAHKSPEGEGLFPELMGDPESKGNTWTVVNATLPPPTLQLRDLFLPLASNNEIPASLVSPYPRTGWCGDVRAKHFSPKRNNSEGGLLSFRAESLLWLHHSPNLPSSCFLSFLSWCWPHDSSLINLLYPYFHLRVCLLG